MNLRNLFRRKVPRLVALAADCRVNRCVVEAARSDGQHYLLVWQPDDIGYVGEVIEAWADAGVFSVADLEQIEEACIEATTRADAMREDQECQGR